MSEYSIVGQRVPHLDAQSKATGRARYTADLALPGMLQGAILRSPHAHARINNIDSSRAERLKGVKAVITGRDSAAVKYGVSGSTRDQFALAIDRVRYVGEEVAAVAAVDIDTAQEALSLISVDYEPLPAVFDSWQAMADGAPAIHENADGNISARFTVAYGDVEAGFASADYVRQDRFQAEAIAHCQLEPYAVLARWDDRGRLEIWMPNQSPFIKQKTLSRTLKIPMNDITVRRVLMGGAFGGRSEFLSPDYCAAFLARKADRPVQIVCTREENFDGTRQKHPFDVEVKTGVKADGTVLARDYRVVADGGAYASTVVFLFANDLIQLLSFYRLAHFRFDGRCVYTNKPVCGAMKGHGNQQLRFADESQMDAIAEALGMDPLEIRLKNAVRPGDLLLNQSRVFSCGLAECLEEVAGVIDRQMRQTPRKPGMAVGSGLACAPFISGFSYGFRSGAAAFVKINEDGQATVITGLVDNGQGNETMAAQVAAEELGIRLEDVRVLWGDTSEAPLDPGSHSMTTTFISGNAVRAAAADARKQLLEIAADHLEANLADLEIGAGRIAVRGSSEGGVPVGAAVLTGLAKGKFVLGRGSYTPPVDQVDFSKGSIDGQVTGAYTYGAAAAEVCVDGDTGQVEVTKVAAAQDCGRAINPSSVEGQIEGSVAFSCGQALSEGLYFHEGSNLNPSFTAYGLPTALDVPAVIPLIVEPGDPHGPFGAKEAAEAAGVAVVPAIANAIFGAAGVRPRSLPANPESILEALGRKPGVHG